MNRSVAVLEQQAHSSGVLFRDSQNRTVYGIVFTKRDLKAYIIKFPERAIEM